jgi:DNA replication protein DnaC
LAQTHTPKLVDVHVHYDGEPGIGAELLFETFSQRYERASTLVTSNLPFEEWTEVFGSERLTGALLDRITHHVHILEMNGDSYRLKQSRRKRNLPPDR